MKQKADIICISWTCAKGLDENDYTNLENKISEVGGKSLMQQATTAPRQRNHFPLPFRAHSASVAVQSVAYPLSAPKPLTPSSEFLLKSYALISRSIWIKAVKIRQMAALPLQLLL